MPANKRTQLDRDIEAKRRYAERVYSIWSSARKNGDNHELIMDRLRLEVWATPGYQALPRWAKSEVSGYNMAFFDQTIRELTEYRVVMSRTAGRSDISGREASLDMNGEALTPDEWVNGRGLTYRDVSEQGEAASYWIATNTRF